MFWTRAQVHGLTTTQDVGAFGQLRGRRRAPHTPPTMERARQSAAGINGLGDVG